MRRAKRGIGERRVRRGGWEVLVWVGSRGGLGAPAGVGCCWVPVADAGMAGWGRSELRGASVERRGGGEKRTTGGVGVGCAEEAGLKRGPYERWGWGRGWMPHEGWFDSGRRGRQPGSPRTDGADGLGGVGFEDLEVGGVAVDAVAAVAGDFFEDAEIDESCDQAVGGGKVGSSG